MRDERRRERSVRCTAMSEHAERLRDLAERIAAAKEFL
jgi:hypothetical protein